MAKPKNFKERQKSLEKDKKKQVKYHAKVCKELMKENQYLKATANLKPKELPKTFKIMGHGLKARIGFFCLCVRGVIKDPTLNFFDKVKAIAWLLGFGED